MAAKKETTEQPTRYSVDYLMLNAAAFNVQPEIIKGALYGQTEASKEEAEAAIKTYLNRPTKTEASKGGTN